MAWKDDVRVDRLTTHKPKENVLYLMRRDQRIRQNHAVELAYSLSYELECKLYIGIEFSKLKLNSIQEQFVIEGLNELYKDCKENNLSLSNIEDLGAFIKAKKIGTVILDFCPMRESVERREEIKELCEDFCVLQCDAHNIVPCQSHDKYRRTPKSVREVLFSLWEQYLNEYEELVPHKFNKLSDKPNPFEKIELNPVHKQYKPILKGGYTEGMKTLEKFFKEKFITYAASRNNPEVDVLSHLSPYLNSGQISPLEIMLRTNEKYKKGKSDNYTSFVSECFIWREIAEHFVFNEPNYDNLDGALPWAKDTLLKHAEDKRPKLYTRENLVHGGTDDPLWNAAQRQLVVTGKIHGYVRIYWAKRLLAWFQHPTEALEMGLYLNDTYALDGNNPNGYLGVMWSICGSMDQGFGERPIYGKIRTKSPFKAPLYIRRWTKPW